jgi:hypothetical protein
VAQSRRIVALLVDLGAIIGLSLFAAEGFTVFIDFFTEPTVPSGHVVLACASLFVSASALLLPARLDPADEIVGLPRGHERKKTSVIEAACSTAMLGVPH